MNVVILYNESNCAAKATALLKRASDRADKATEWRVKPWHMDLLNVPSLAEAALGAAANAHLIVLAIRNQASISSWVLNWLQTWADHRRVQDAALAVFDGGNADTFSTAVTPELYQFAERHGISFLFGDMFPAEDESGVFVHDLHKREVAQTSTMLHILEYASHDHYGINE